MRPHPSWAPLPANRGREARARRRWVRPTQSRLCWVEPSRLPADLVYHLDLIVAQHPYVGRQGDEVGVFEIFFVGFAWRDCPEQGFPDRFRDRRFRLLGRDDRIFVIDQGKAPAPDALTKVRRSSTGVRGVSNAVPSPACAISGCATAACGSCRRIGSSSRTCGLLGFIEPRCSNCRLPQGVGSHRCTIPIGDLAGFRRDGCSRSARLPRWSFALLSELPLSYSQQLRSNPRNRRLVPPLLSP